MRQALHERFIRVSILVFMEVFLESVEIDISPCHSRVSILVFMEVFLECSVTLATFLPIICFNPCFYGSVSGIDDANLSPSGLSAFQSLFLWKCFWN